MVKLSLLLIVIAVWLIISQAENVITEFFPGNLEVYVGMFLLIIAGVQLGKKGIKREFNKLKGGIF